MVSIIFTLWEKTFQFFMTKILLGKNLVLQFLKIFFYVNIFNNFKSLLILLQCCFCIMFLGFFLP